MPKRRKLGFKNLISILGFIGIVSILAFFTLRPSKVEAGWFDNAWLYRAPISITNGSGGALTDFQVSVTVDSDALSTAGKLQSDCDDLRFTDVNGVLLNYWLQDSTDASDANTCSAADATVWVKVPNIPTSGVTIYMYYGNSAATVYSNGTATFDFFEPFSSSTLNASRWSATGAYSCNAYSCTITTGSIYSNNAILADSRSYMYEHRVKWTTFAGDYGGIQIAGDQAIAGNNTGSDKLIMLMQGSLNDYDVIGYAANGTAASYNLVSAQAEYTATANTYHISGFSMDSSNIKFYNNRAAVNTVVGSWTAPPYMILGYFFGSGAGTNDTKDMEMDWALARKFASTEPSSSNGTEEKSPSPLAHWSFDEGYGSTAYSNPRNAFPGTVSGATWQNGSQCVKGRCLFFDGVNDYVDTPDNALLDLTNTITLETWIKPLTITSTSSWNRIISKRSYDLAMTTNGSAGLIFRVNDGSTHDVSSGIIPELGKWTHVAVVYDGANVKFYINGVLEYTSSSFTFSASNFTDRVVIGNTFASGAYDRPFNGYIDEPKIYNYARTATQIANDFNSAGTANGVTGQISSNSASSGGALSDGLVGYWKMDEASWNGTSSEVLDSSGKGDNGTSQCDVVYDTCASGVPSTTAPGKYNRAGNFNQGGQRVYIDNTDYTTSERLESEAFWFKADTLPSSGFKNHLLIHLSTYDASGQDPTSGTHIRTNIYINPDGTIGNQGLSYAGSLLCSDWTIGQYFNQILTTTTAVTTGTWNHYAYTVDWGVNNNVIFKVYLNGKLEATYTDPGKSCYSQSYYTWLGKGKNTAASYRDFDGLMDEYRRYKDVLSAAEIKALYDWGPEPLMNMALDENTGSTTYDNQGNGFSGTLTNGPTWNPGKFGSAVNFDGTDDYIDVGTSSTLAFTGAFTVSAWVKPDSGALSGTPRIIGKRDNNNGYLLSPTGGTPRFLVGNGTTFSSAQATTGMSAGQWYHMVGTWDGSNAIKIYINGRLEATTTGVTTLSNSSTSFDIGADSAGSYFDGVIDAVQVFNYELNPRQISNLLNAMSVNDPAVGSPVGHPILYWNFDEGYGTTAYDSSGNAYNGTLTSMASPATSSSGWSHIAKFGKGLAFDGTDDHVLLADNDNFSVSNTGQLSVSAWVNFDTLASRQCVICKGANTQYEWEIRSESDGTFSVLLYSSGGTAYMGGVVSRTLSTGRWYHLAFTADTSIPRMVAYVDGVKVQTFTSTSGSYTNGTAGLRVGRRGDSVHPLDGYADEAKVYNYALSESEMALDYNQGKSVIFGDLSTTSAGTVADNSVSRSYCVPGDTATCNPPIGEWKLDENISTTANDTSGNANNGTLTNSPVWAAGKFGSGIKFDGTDDYVNIADNSTLEGFTTMTISVWVNPSSCSTYNDIVNKENSTYIMRLNNCQLDAGVFTSAWVTIRDNTALSTNTWYYLTMVYDGANVSLYKNGQYISSYTNTNGASSAQTGTVSTNANPLRIGANSAGNGRYFAGIIDEVKIYNYARTPAQIAWEFNRGAPVAWYKMDECEGTTIYDWAPNANGGYNGSNGTLTIGATGTNTAVGTCTGSAGQGWFDGASGRINASVEFDGTDDAIALSNPAFAVGTRDFSYTAWIKLTNPSTTNLRFFSVGGNGFTYEGWVDSAQRITAHAGDASAARSTAIQPTSMAISTGVWYHVAAVYDRDTDLKLYVNGVLVVTQTGITSYSATSYSSSTGEIGGYSGSTSFGLDGQVDDVRFFNYPLTQAQIKTIYNDGAVNFR